MICTFISYDYNFLSVHDDLFNALENGSITGAIICEHMAGGASHLHILTNSTGDYYYFPKCRCVKGSILTADEFISYCKHSGDFLILRGIGRYENI